MAAQNEQDKRKNLGNIVKILVFMRPYYLRLYSLLGLTILLSVLAMIPPIVTMQLVDKVFTQGDTSLFLPLGILMVALPIVSATCGFFQTMSMF